MNQFKKQFFTFLFCLMILNIGFTQMPNNTNDEISKKELKQKIDALANQVEPKVIEWRRHLHQNPELSNREFKTAEKVAKHLRELGLEVKTGIAHTGVVGILKGGKPGPTVALRADMDALPVTERVDIPFASKVKSTYNDIEVGVMHACGHDTHVAMLMGTAEVLSKVKKDIKGTVVFIFQPAEEGAPQGEEGGAELMVEEGVLENPKVDVIFGLHINSKTEVGKIAYKPGGTMAAVDRLEIKVKGKEKASFWRQEEYTETDMDGNMNTFTRDIKEKMYKMILEFRGNCWQFNEDLMPGDYALNF